MEIRYKVWDKTNQRYLQPIELLKFVSCNGIDLDDMGHPTMGIISITDKEGYEVQLI